MSDKKALQCLLDFAVKGVGYWGDMARTIGVSDAEVDKYIFEALVAIDNADENTLSALAAKAPALQYKITEAFAKKNGRRFSGFLPPHGKQLQITEDRAEQIALGNQCNVPSRVDDDIKALRTEIMANIKKIAAAGKGDEASYAIVQQGLSCVISDKMENEDVAAYAKKLAGFVK